MAHTNNSRVSMSSVQFTYNSSHHLPHFHYPGQPSTSMAQLDSPGHHCIIGPSHCYDPFTKKTNTRDFQRDTVLSYPSPPPTNSQPKRSVPLPSLTSNREMVYCAPHSQHFGGILDSPVVTKHEALGCHAPLSPPPTIPTSTHALPTTDDALPSISEQDDFDEPFLGLPSPLRSPGQDGDSTHHLLSPLSPEWVSNQISSDMPLSHSEDNCVLLHRNHHILDRTFDGLPDSLGQPSSSFSRPALPLLDIPDTSYPSENSWDEPLSSFMDSDFDDESALSTPISPACSPLPRKYTFEPDELFMSYDPEEKYRFPPSSSPSIHPIHLPEHHDIPTSPSSPSLRSFSNLPMMEMDDDDIEYLRSPSLSPPSPIPSLLSLPGADIDDELLPAHLGSSSFIPDDADPMPATPLTNRSLLLLDDPNDVPPPRSPSPENFHLDPALLENCADPEVRRLYDIRKKSQAAERSARLLEARMLEDGSVQVRWEARRTRKREKERSGEVTAMLRLKLTERGVLDDLEMEAHQPTKSNVISSMEHLVAKMLLRRNDTSRSLANRKTPYFEKYHPHSPLSRSFLSNDSETDDEVSDMEVDEEDSWPPVPWPMDLDKNGYHIPG